MSRAEQLDEVRLEEALAAHTRRHGTIYHRELSIDAEVCIYPLLFNRFRVAVGPGGEDYDGGYDIGENFDTFEEALARAEAVTARELQDHLAQRGVVRRRRDRGAR